MCTSLDLSRTHRGMETSRSPLVSLPGGAHLGPPPAFELGQHVPVG